MEQVMEFFENMNEVVYITDMDTYEIVYMNKKTRDEYGGYPVEHFADKKCYEVFQRSSTPCKMCTNHRLKHGEFVEWQYYNPILDKYFILKDSMFEKDGRRYRIEIAMDMSGETQRNAMFREYQNMEAIANEGFRLALQEDDPNVALDVILEYLGKALSGERTYVFERDEENCDSNTYEWVRHGVSPSKDTLQKLPPEICEDWYRTFREKRNVVIRDIESAKDMFPTQYQILKDQNIHSLVVLPLYMRGEIIGFYGVDNPSGISMDYAVNLLKITANFIVSTLRRREMFRKLTRMSHYDYLTGLGNRYAMDAYIERLRDGQDIGVLYTDMTGLKRVNDEEGHEAGDRLLVRSTESMKSVFDSQGIFRLGGDEFLVLCVGLSENELKEKAEWLKNLMRENRVVAAIGTAWQAGITREQIHPLVVEAEKQMYIDKAAYYITNGIDRRR